MPQRDDLRAAFFEECEDLLAQMGDGLALMSDAADMPELETLHSVFRAVHSIKGGAGAFGLNGLVDFAHAFETVLDLMRSGRLSIGSTGMPTLLRAYDVLSDLVAAARDGVTEPSSMAAILVELDILADGGGADEEDIEFVPVPLDLSLPFASPVEPEPAPLGYMIAFAPSAALYLAGHEPAALLRALVRLGSARVIPDTDEVSPLAAFDPGSTALRWQLELSTCASRDEVDAILDTVSHLADVMIAPLVTHAAGMEEEASTQSRPSLPDQVPSEPGPIASLAMSNSDPVPVMEARVKGMDAAPASPIRGQPEATPVQMPVASTIRVNLDRVDRLINQIGELVIMEAMLSQAITNAQIEDGGDIANGLEGIKNLAASIQESVMSIRAQPLKPVFQRMQRITREAADATGKSVRLQTIGEGNEVDKTVIERLVDPLTHMIRNSVDHGIETAERRRSVGKPAEGLITLSAAHRSGRVIIDITDDGAGIDRARVRQIAEERGLVAPGAHLAPSDIDNLLFMPGFSSKEEVSALSGRGVGLDVVRREIQALGGRVTIQSVPGQGTTFTIALPLTLAVLEGMLIDVGGETMVLPLSSIVETMRPASAQVQYLGRTARMVASRGALIPIIDLAESFGFDPVGPLEQAILIIVEYDADRCVALAVNQIHDQRQVVIKSLEDNYGDVPGISAATILGDGRIALIIDPEEIVQSAAAESIALPHVANG
jgi:two-component system, chemotaxis family, sensor kinase CheA